MVRYWPRHADGLPPGQRLMGEMPRFTDLPHLPPPAMPAEPRLEIRKEGEPVVVLTAADLQALGPRDRTADFHCVTTWSVTGLVWTGVPLREVLASVKHLVTLDLRAEQPRVMAREHLRARVALEERHPRLPGSVLRVPYRLLIAPTAHLAERTLHRRGV